VASSIIYSESEEKNKMILNDSLDTEKEVHADFRETSFMLFKHPEMVKDCYRSLQPIYMDIEQFIKAGGKCWRKYGIKEGYIGNPAKASREQGEIQFKDMVKKTGELILNFIIYDDIPELSKGIKSAMNYIVLR
jgi:creatinine amidohydrolase